MFARVQAGTNTVIPDSHMTHITQITPALPAAQPGAWHLRGPMSDLVHLPATDSHRSSGISF